GREAGIRQVVPSERVRYLAEIGEAVRAYHAETERIAEIAARAQRLDSVHGELVAAGADSSAVGSLLGQARDEVPREVADQIAAWPSVVESYSGDEQVVVVRDQPLHTRLVRESLSGNKIPRVAL